MFHSTVSSFTAIADGLRETIDAALRDYARLGEGCPPPLAEAIRYGLLSPGKRLRPMLTLLAAEATGGSYDKALPAACAVEMVHTYSLIHDDLPAMDDDDLRRGRPTCHKQFGEALAILAGDALLTLAFETLAKDIRPPHVAARCCAELASAAGACALVGGQADDLGQQFAVADTDTLESIHRRKTAALFIASLKLGALTARADNEQFAALEVYGQHLGLAFQIVDDLLDVDGDESTLGKRIHKDNDRGKLTFPAMLGVEPSRRRAAESVDAACSAIERLGPSASALDGLARYVLERNQ